MTTTNPCTPQPSPLPPDTPPTLHFTAQSGYRSGNLSLARDAIQKDLKYYLQVPYDSLLRSIFGSPLPDIPDIRQKLVDLNVLNYDMTEWTAFTITPTQSKAKEIPTFHPIIDIISKIFDQVPDSHVFAVDNPNKVPRSERNNRSRPDAHIVHEGPAVNEGRTVTRSDKHHWHDIAVSFEFKKDDKVLLEKDDKEKIIWNMHNVMREDPRRCFALGITIENTSMRLWCNSRALVVASEPIDFCKEICHFITLFYLIGRSTEVQLGWDPTVERILAGKEIQYRFKISNQSFTTTRRLASYGADVIVGRATRVYEAQDEAGNFVAIKDSWRDEGRDSEGAIQEKIFGDMRDKLGEIEATEAKKYFVTIRAYEDVVISGVNDISFSFGDSDHFEWIFVSTDPVSGKLYVPSTGHVSDVDLFRERPQPPKNIPRRIHTRTVFEQVGIPLQDVPSLADSLACLCGAQKALYCLHKAGWVHRDFGVNNVLWFESEGESIGRLTDFEFAKRVDSEVTHEERTGTMNYMAIEVEKQAYIFMPPSLTTLNEPPFRMNYLHDLESMWWTSMWILFHHTDKNSPTGDLYSQLKYYRQAFPSAIDHTPRRDFFIIFRDRLLASQVLSDTYRGACAGIIGLADALQTFYKKAEESYPVIIKVDDSLLKEAHRKMSGVLYDAVEKLKNSDIRLKPLHEYLEEKSDSGRDKKRVRYE